MLRVQQYLVSLPTVPLYLDFDPKKIPLMMWIRAPVEQRITDPMQTDASEYILYCDFESFKEQV